MNTIAKRIAAIMAASMMWACGGNDSQESSWEMPEENIIAQIAEVMKANEKPHWQQYETTPVSNTKMLIGNSETLSCYQENDSTWLVMNGSYHDGGEIYSCVAFEYVNGKVRRLGNACEFLNLGNGGYPTTYELNDKEFTISSGKAFKGGVTFRSGYTELKRCESDDFCKYIFRDDKPFDFRSEFDTKELDTACVTIGQNDIVFKNGKCGFMTRESDSTYKAITIGSPVSEAMELPLFVRFGGATDNTVSTRTENGKFVVTRNIFYNLKKNIGGFADFTADKEGGKIEGIRLYVDKLDKDEYFVDYRKPVLTLAYWNNQPYVEHWGRYNEKGQLSEFMLTEVQEVTGYIINRLKYQDDEISEVASISLYDCMVDDVAECEDFRYESDFSEYVLGQAEEFLGRGSLMWDPFLTDLEYDKEGRVSKAKYRDYVCTFEYKDDYCIRTDKSKSETIKRKAYYYHSRQKPVNHFVTADELANIYDMIPSDDLLWFYGKQDIADLKNDFQGSYLLRSNDHISENCDRFTHYMLWAYRVDSDTTLAFYDYSLEQVANKLSVPEETRDFVLQEYIISNGQISKTSKDIPTAEDIAKAIDADASKVKINYWQNSDYKSITAHYELDGEEKRIKFNWTGKRFEAE